VGWVGRALWTVGGGGRRRGRLEADAGGVPGRGNHRTPEPDSATHDGEPPLRGPLRPGTRHRRRAEPDPMPGRRFRSRRPKQAEALHVHPPTLGTVRRRHATASPMPARSPHAGNPVQALATASPAPRPRVPGNPRQGRGPGGFMHPRAPRSLDSPVHTPAVCRKTRRAPRRHSRQYRADKSGAPPQWPASRRPGALGTKPQATRPVSRHMAHPHPEPATACTSAASPRFAAPSGREPRTGGGPSPIPCLSGGFVRAAQNKQRPFTFTHPRWEPCAGDTPQQAPPSAATHAGAQRQHPPTAWPRRRITAALASRPTDAKLSGEAMPDSESSFTAARAGTR